MKLMGHRGAPDVALENTMRAFQGAVDCGVDAVEMDVHQTKDGVWVVHHDHTIDRLTHSSGTISKFNLEDLKKIKCKDGQEISSLEEVLVFLGSKDVDVQIELKCDGDFINLGEIISKNINIKRVAVISFNHRWLKHFKIINPSIKTYCLLYGLPNNVVEIIKEASAVGVSLSTEWIDGRVVAECHAAGFIVTCWNANDFEKFNEMCEIGVDYIATDCPKSAMIWKKSISCKTYEIKE